MDPQATAELEAKGYVAGLVALRNYEFVDASKIFIFAHSLGPLIASLALRLQAIRGVVVAGTIGRSWFEYTPENAQRQSALVGEPQSNQHSSAKPRLRFPLAPATTPYIELELTGTLGLTRRLDRF